MSIYAPPQVENGFCLRCIHQNVGNVNRPKVVKILILTDCFLIKSLIHKSILSLVKLHYQMSRLILLQESTSSSEAIFFTLIFTRQIFTFLKAPLGNKDSCFNQINPKSQLSFEKKNIGKIFGTKIPANFFNVFNSK